ncbi:MAG TPA: plastocyanin/azurin family copper-binding protein [Thermoanaerobaculia bacterium]|jgi:plastocyanin|nr:plastocyanin/azurin family copper-binding protein [Thermoanaerobaculia bacterium]
MARNRKIDIKDQPGQTLASFHPPNLQAKVGDLIFWVNDSNVAHWPAPSAKPEDRTKWLAYQIPGRTADQEPASSQSISFDAAGKFDYVCSLHPEEKGSITVA